MCQNWWAGEVRLQSVRTGTDNNHLYFFLFVLYFSTFFTFNHAVSIGQFSWMYIKYFEHIVYTHQLSLSFSIFIFYNLFILYPDGSPLLHLLVLSFFLPSLPLSSSPLKGGVLLPCHLTLTYQVSSELSGSSSSIACQGCITRGSDQRAGNWVHDRGSSCSPYLGTHMETKLPIGYI